MAYAPRQSTYRIKWKVVLPLLLLVILLLYAVTSVFIKKEENKNKYTVCGFTPDKTADLLNKKSADVFTISDYVYYGESLGLYEKSYSPENSDTLSGKTVILHNVCDNSETTMTMENTADQKIILNSMKPGFYEITVIDNLVKKRIVFEEALKHNTFYTAQRNGRVNEIKILADKDILQDQDIQLNQHYMFLQIDAKMPADEIDVLLDPYGMNIDLSTVPDKGLQENGLIENDEMYDAALMMKKELEAYGLRVELSKTNKNEAIATYGDKGRLSKGYQKHAKYYILMQFNGNSQENAKGMVLWHSAYSSPTLARNMMYRMKKESYITASQLYYDDYNWPGVVASNLNAGLLDGKMIYDTNMQLRESGGRATLAANYSESSKKENSSFANANGMQGLEIDFAYIANKEDALNWKNHKAEIVKSVAKAFAEGIKAGNK